MSLLPTSLVGDDSNSPFSLALFLKICFGIFQFHLSKLASFISFFSHTNIFLISANPATLQYPGVDILQQQPHPATLSTHNRPIAPSHLSASALESAFQNTQNISTIDPTIITSQGLPNVQQRVTTDSEHLPVEQTKDAPLSESIEQENTFHNVTGSSAFIPTIPATTQPNADYTMGHSSRQKGDNLGLGQTTFGGQQKITDTHMPYGQTPTEQPSYQQDEVSFSQCFISMHVGRLECVNGSIHIPLNGEYSPTVIFAVK